jgi:hypothetical protein
MQLLPSSNGSHPTNLSGAVWRKSSHSQGSGAECIELASLFHTVGVRDSKNPTGPKLTFSRAELTAFFTAIRRGDHDH